MKKQNDSYNDRLEKILTAIFGGIGTIAIIVNLFLKGFSLENFLDGLKDIASLIVVIAVFLIASKLFKRDHKKDFNSIFKFYLQDWINQNDFLVCENFEEKGKGKYEKKYCSMVIDHSNLVTRKQYARDAAINKEKGAFVYLPYRDENGNWEKEFDFRFNKKTFSRQNLYRTTDGEVNLKAILEQFATRIMDNFKDIGISASANQETIKVSYEGMEQSEGNAKQLIDMVEFVKTMVLALA
jgi:hypothetical protein